MRRAGFSLVELIIALSILGIGLIGSMRVFPVGLRASQRAQLRTRAAFIAQQTLEPLKTTAWDQLKEGEVRKEQKPFVIVTTIRSVQPEHVGGALALKQVEVSVEYPQEGKLRTASFVTYLRHPSP